MVPQMVQVGNMNCAIIQARMSSTRLPGKVLMEVNGRPLLLYMIERLKGSETIAKVVVATSSDESDNPLAKFCEANGVDCYRGSLDDVLDRYYQAAVKCKCETVIRLTGDCPIIDPKVIDTVVRKFESGGYDFVANTAPPENTTYPEGMDVEVFSFSALEKAWKDAKKPSDREHVTFYFWKNPGLFSTFRCDLDRNYSKYRVTVDYPMDFNVISDIITEFYPENKYYTMQEIIAFLDTHKETMGKNSGIKPFSGWESSFRKDAQSDIT